MAYNRGTSYAALACKALAWLCDHWLWPVLVFALLSPLSPHVVIAGGNGVCTYAGRHGIIADLTDQAICPTVKFYSVY